MESEVKLLSNFDNSFVSAEENYVQLINHEKLRAFQCSSISCSLRLLTAVMLGRSFVHSLAIVPIKSIQNFVQVQEFLMQHLFASCLAKHNDTHIIESTNHHFESSILISNELFVIELYVFW